MCNNIDKNKTNLLTWKEIYAIKKALQLSGY